MISVILIVRMGAAISKKWEEAEKHGLDHPEEIVREYLGVAADDAIQQQLRWEREQHGEHTHMTFVAWLSSLMRFKADTVRNRAKYAMYYSALRRRFIDFKAPWLEELADPQTFAFSHYLTILMSGR
jgi:hypothetical protein